MSAGERRRRRLTPEQERERFDAGGADFQTALERVLAGGPDDHSSAKADDEPEADE